MRVLGVLAAWSVLAVLATMCFALGGSIGYRRGVRDTLAQLRERRAGKAGCRPLPANHLRRRSSGQARPGATARRARWRVGPSVPVHGATPLAALRSGRWTSAALAGVAAFLLVGVPGTAVGATTAQPGDSLWTVKLGLEQVRLALATGAERQARVHVDLAAVRLGELSGLLGTDARVDVVGQVTDGLANHATAASEQLPRVARTAVRSELQQRIQAVTSRQVAVVDAMIDRDCGGSAARDCVALGETLEETVALRETTAAVAVATPVPADDVALNPGSTPASAMQAEEAAGAAPVAEASGEPAENAGATASSSPDESSAPPQGTPAADEPAAKPTPASTPSASPAKTPKPSSSPTPTPTPTPTPAPPEPAEPDPPQAESGTAAAGAQPRAHEDASAQAQP